MVNLSIQKKKQGEAELCQAQVKLNSVLYQKAFVYLLSEIFLSEIEYYQKKKLLVQNIVYKFQIWGKSGLN